MLKPIIDNFSIQSSNQNQNDQKKYIIMSFLQKMVNSIEIANILGITSAIEMLNTCIIKEQENNIRTKLWADFEIEKMIKFLFSVENFVSQSSKTELLCDFIKAKQNENSRILIIVRAHKTASYLLNCLNQDQAIKDHWMPS